MYKYLYVYVFVFVMITMIKDHGRDLGFGLDQGVSDGLHVCSSDIFHIVHSNHLEHDG